MFIINRGFGIIKNLIADILQIDFKPITKNGSVFGQAQVYSGATNDLLF
jgi:hypothetical protein